MGRGARQPGQATDADTSPAPAAEASPGTHSGGSAAARRESRDQAVTAQAIAAVLAAAGYPASTHHRDTGWGEGYRLHPQPDGTVLIGHEAIAEDISGVAATDRAHQ